MYKRDQTGGAFGCCRVLPDGSICQILLNSESELCKASAAVVDSVGTRSLVGKIGVT